MSSLAISPAEEALQKGEEKALQKGPSYFPQVLWRRGCRGWLAMILTLPVFLIYFVLMVIMWFPLGLIVILLKILTCQRVALGHFINCAVPAVDIAMGIVAAHNPLVPHSVLANVGKINMSIFYPVLMLIGRCYDSCRRRQAKQSGVVENVPAADKNFLELQISENVWTVQAQFSEGLESVCLMTVIRGDDWVMFFNPVFAPLDVYRRFGEGKRRVVLFLHNNLHHMAADLCLVAHPHAEIWGSPGAGTRHVPNLKVLNPSQNDMGLPGFQHFDVSMTIYDEHWLFYEPEGLLLLGDFMPLLMNAIDLPTCLTSPLWAVGRCCTRYNMTNYQKSLVTDPQCIIDALRVIFTRTVKHTEGAHGRDIPGVERQPPLKELYDYWGWILPVDMARQIETRFV